MNQCERLSDRMPDVALGRSEWSPEERQHLDSCADCLAEWRLVEMTSRLGASLPGSPDADVLTASLLTRLAAERGHLAVRRQRWLAAGLAAAAVVLIAVRVPHSSPTVSRAVPASVATSGQGLPLPELDDLPVSELQSILGTLDDSSGVSRPFDDPGLDDFDNHDLERALSAWEG